MVSGKFFFLERKPLETHVALQCQANLGGGERGLEPQDHSFTNSKQALEP